MSIIINYSSESEQVNPYHHIRNCIFGKWKMTILHHIHNYGAIRFNQTLNILPVSEKVLSQQLKELIKAGLVKRIVYDCIPVKVEYVLTESGDEVIKAMDLLFVWAIKDMKQKEIEIDPDAFVVHYNEKYKEALSSIVDYEEYISKADKAVKQNEFVIKDREKKNK